MIEKNSQKNAFTEEILEYFDSKLNIGIAVQTIPGGSTKTFSDYNKDELIAVFNYKTDNEQCMVLSLKESITLTPFYIIVVNGEEKIVSPLSILFENTGSFQVK